MAVSSSSSLDPSPTISLHPIVVFGVPDVLLVVDNQPGSPGLGGLVPVVARWRWRTCWPRRWPAVVEVDLWWFFTFFESLVSQ